jgi:glycerol-3-phosphate cytidylyltransferase
MKFKIGYTTGVFDLFHIGHLNLLRNARSFCDFLIVGVTTDELVEYKGKRSVIPFLERLEIVRNIKYVDLAITQDDLDKISAHKKLGFDVLFVGDDWFSTERWKNTEESLKKLDVKVIYFPYTKSTSSTLINQTLELLRTDKKN